jgi:hypothetical protein
MAKVLNPNESYTFSRYFDLPYSPEDILADLGCTDRAARHVLEYLPLHRVPQDLELVTPRIIGILQR